MQLRLDIYILRLFYYYFQAQMTCRQVTKMGNPVLRQVCQEIPIEDIQTKDIQQLIADLKVTMISHGGIGIAAPQIGISKQICLVDVPNYSERYGKLDPVPFTVVINPKVTIIDQQTEGFWEGCLSIPGIKGYVRRPRGIKVTFFNEKAEQITLQLHKMGAVVFQHEVDHLQGILFIDKVIPTKISFIEQFNKFGLWKEQENTV